MTHHGRRLARGLGLDGVVGDWRRSRQQRLISRPRNRRRAELIGTVLERLESRTMLSTSSVPGTSPPPAVVQQATLNLVLQPATGGALGPLAGLIVETGATVKTTGIPGY